ncbi:hypothetical protein GCM10020360_22580 [Nonlabens tegetincola]
MRKTLATTIIILTALSLTGCGGGSAGVSDSLPTESEQDRDSSANEIGVMVGEGLSDSWNQLRDFGKGVWEGMKSSTEH